MNFNFSNHSYKNLELNIYTCGREKCESLHSYGPAIRSGYMIHHVLKGKGIFKVNDKIYQLEKNDAFLIEPNVLIYYEANKEEPWEYLWIGFNGIKAKEYLYRSSLRVDNPILNFDKKGKLSRSMDRIVSASTMKTNKDLLLTSRLYEFLFLLVERYPNLEINNEIKQQKYVEDALLYIEQNYANNITINDVSKYISIDRSYLHRLFKQYLNKSPQELLINLRIDKSCYLLINSSLKIGDIARSVGYKDVFLFSKTFKKIKKCTPTDYKNNNQILNNRK